MEQDPFLLEEEEQAVEVTTHLTYTIAICARWIVDNKVYQVIRFDDTFEESNFKGDKAFDK